ncbi:MAG: nitrous oxide-stimulated promoter family protein [Deltaproteobacteria bacterium]|nr:nitrous oxide-stimulated promoter family protein [Deltaproteobacteria bacterium]
MFRNKRIQREASTIEAMIRIYCRHHHGTNSELCKECDLLLQYALVRLKKCPFQEKKTTCGKCPIHCYKPGMRKKIQEVMRYVGPRMVLHHPIMGIMHIVDGFRKSSPKGKQKLPEE